MTLAGFSGLVAAFRRGGEWKPIDSFRLRQIPEMGLATALIALLTFPLADTTTNASAAIRMTSALALLFTVAHILVLLRRLTRSRIILGWVRTIQAGVVDLAVIAAAVISVAAGRWTTYEWLLLLMPARPVVAFAIVLGKATAAGSR